MFWVFSHHLVAASAPLRNRILGCRYGTSSGQWNFVLDFLPKCIQPTTYGPKLMFWAVSHHLVAASTLLQNRVLGCRLGTSLCWWNYCRVLQPKHIQSTTLGSKLTIWVVSHHFVAASAPLQNRCPGMPFGHGFGLMELFLSFPAKMHPIHYFWSKTHILGDFAPFVCHKSTVVKSGPRMLFWHELGPTKQLLSFSHKMHSIH